MDLRISDLKNRGFAINDEVTHLPSDFSPTSDIIEKLSSLSPVRNTRRMKLLRFSIILPISFRL